MSNTTDIADLVERVGMLEAIITSDAKFAERCDDPDCSCREDNTQVEEEGSSDKSLLDPLRTLALTLEDEGLLLAARTLDGVSQGLESLITIAGAGTAEQALEASATLFSFFLDLAQVA